MGKRRDENTDRRRVEARTRGSQVTVQKRRRKKRRRTNKVLIAILLFVIIAMVGACTLVWIKYGPTNERYDLNKYFGVEKESELGITVNNEVMEMKGLRIDNTVYIPYEIVRDYLNGRFYFDSNENILLYTLEDAIVRTDVGSKTYTIAKEEYTEDYAILKTEGHAAYIAIDFVKEYTDLDYVVYEQPGRVMIGTDFEERVVADVKRNTEVRLRGGVKSPILTEVSKGDTVRVIEEIGDWKKICTADGVVGYVKSSRLKKEEKITIDRDFQEQTFSNISVGKTINLAWHQVTSQTANNSVLEVIANTKGLTTISPTWFSVVDNAGNISSIASSTYVNYAHQSGIDVWALVDNFSDNIDQLELLSHTSARENLVNQLISEALKSGIDGINVDFEQIPTEAGEHYIQFIRELSVKCRLNNLVLSVDNYVPMGYNAHYHREEQGVVADYVIIMGYDEHYNGSFEAGSVASYDYVKSGIEETLKDVPAEKVVNAMPFYTRLWKEVPKTEEELESQEGSEAGLYEMKVTSEALGMTAARNRVNSAGAEIVWDDKVKQNYAEWQGADGATYKVWLEDASSLEAKLQLMKEYNLAGTAAWKLGFETPDIWDLILKYVN